MAKTKKVEKPVEEKPKEKKAELVKTTTGNTMIDANSGRPVINPALLEPDVRDKVIAITDELRKAMSDVKTGVLRIGAALLEAELLLKPRKLWVPYLNSFPNFKQAQAYRYINGYKAAKTNLPPAVLEVALTTGMDIIGNKDRPFGKYTDAAKLLPPPKDADTGKATAWLNQLEKRYRDAKRLNNKGPVDSDKLQQEAFKAVLSRGSKVPDKQQRSWYLELFGYIFDNLGWMSEEINRKAVPKSWSEKKEDSSKG